MNAMRTPERITKEELRQALASLSPAERAGLLAPAGRRKRSEREFLGLPLYDFAIGPDPSRGEARGHARGVLAIGDVATGVVAVGGWARGLFAIGGVATGVFAFGGLAVGLVSAIGGAALAFGLAIGGGALGSVAIGGASLGHYAVGGAPHGTYVVGPRRVDPEALDLFRSYGLALPAPRR